MTSGSSIAAGGEGGRNGQTPNPPAPDDNCPHQLGVAEARRLLSQGHAAAAGDNGKNGEARATSEVTSGSPIAAGGEGGRNGQTPNPPASDDNCHHQHGVADARKLLDQGYAAAAGVMARIVLERRLRELRETNGTPARRMGLRAAIDLARHCGTIREQTAKRLHLAAIIGGRCAHGRSLSTDKVGKMIDDVAAFVA